MKDFSSRGDFLKQYKLLYTILFRIRYLLNKKFVEKHRKANIFMMHTGRVGSTVLADLLNQHSKIHWDGEIFPGRNKYFTKKTRKNNESFIKLRMNQKRSVYYGFELKGSDNQVYGNYSVNTPLIEFIDNIKKIQFNNYILLYRKNYLKQYVSYYFARQSKIHHTKTIQNKLKTLNINTHNCLWFKENKTLTDHFNYLDDFYNKVKKNLLHDEFLQINYEDDILNNPIIAYKKICNFIGINYETPSVTLRKTNPFPLADIIENYSEVENYMRGTKYEWMLYN